MVRKFIFKLSILSLFVAVLAAAAAQSIDATFQFSIEPNIKSCFAQETGRDSTTVMINYIIHASPGSGTMTVNVLNPVKHVHSTHTLELVESSKKEMKTLNFNAAQAGRWDICFTWLGNFAVRLEADIDAVVDLNYRPSDIKAEDYSVITDKLMPLFEKAEYEINYMSARQDRFEATVKSTYFRVVFFTVFQLFVMVGVVGWQVWSLRTFFKQKKLV